MNFIDERLLDYSVAKSNCPSDICDELEKYTKETQSLARMLCGRLEASLLGFLIKSHNVQKILEIGTFTGYSALTMAECLPESGQVYTIDKNKKINSIAKRFWDKSEHGHKITAFFGEGVSVLPKLIDENYQFQMVFIDADKANYLNYLKLSLELLSEQGIIVIDNVLWSGRVVEGVNDHFDKSTIHIKELNNFVAENSYLYGTLLPMRDGIFLITRQ